MTTISKRMLAVQLLVWSVADMAVFLRVCPGKLSRKMGRASLLNMVGRTIVVFSPAQWERFLSSQVMPWVSASKPEKKHRRGPSDLQNEVYNAIAVQIVKKKPRSIFASGSRA